MGSESYTGTERETDQLKVTGEYTFEFKEGECEGRWLRILNEHGTLVEGAHFVPKGDANGEIVVFHPGLPGDGVSWFEERDTPELLRDGYEVFVARHQGLVPTETNKQYFHNEGRRMSDYDATTRPISVRTWLQEPQTSLTHFSQKQITLITHSFGALAGELSLVELQRLYGDTAENPLNNLQRWIVLGGVVHDLKEGGVTDQSKGITLDTWRSFFEWLEQSGIYNMENAEQALADFSNRS